MGSFPRTTLPDQIYSKKILQKSADSLNTGASAPSILYMKKLLLLTAVLLGAATASQAGVRFNVGIGIPLSPPVVVTQPCAPVYSQPYAQACEPAPQVCAPAPVVIAPAVVDVRF